MKYGVIVCPKCRKVKAVDLNYKSTKCFFCNKTIIISKTKIIFESNKLDKIRHVIGQINAELMEKTK
jgi:hypothetical protein